ncbi:hypothetical protein NBRC116583_13400 [Arenicella sp. 4NH20-0111]|uniref:hypothetical protein n=1 Tax=Arenicella sp. 4NH20-0111 TaxID=3127648 RepID=UPI00310B7F48
MVKLLVRIFCLFISFTASAASAFQYNDVAEIESNRFVLGKADAFFTGKMKTPDLASSALLKIAISNVGAPLSDQTISGTSAQDQSKSDAKAIDENDEISFELFFRSASDHSGQFDAGFRLKFRERVALINRQEAIYIRLPSELRFSDSQSLRLDIDGCAECRVVLDKSALFSSIPNTSAINVQFTPITRHYLGASRVEPLGVDVALDDWNTNHLLGNARRFSLSGNDAFFASPALDIDSTNLAGLYFKLKTPLKKSSYQVFYATESHQFIERSSSIVEVSAGPEGISEFFVPLGYLSKEHPVQTKLARIRLDIDPPANSPNHGHWSLERVFVVPESDRGSYTQYLPARILQRKAQRPNASQLLSGTLHRIFSDHWFVIFYLMLLALVIGVLVRRLRRL